MLNSHLISSNVLQQPSFGAQKNGFKDSFLKPFLKQNNGLSQPEAKSSDTPAKAGKVLLARLQTSVESRFTAASLTNPKPTADAASDFSPQAVSERILGFVKQRLEQEKANGASQERLQDLYEQAKSGIEKGFAEARDMIAEQGLFSDEVKDNFLATVSKTQAGLDELGEELSPQEPAVAQQPVLPSGGKARGGNASLVAGAQDLFYNQQRNFEMQVKTQDGDLVTIKVSGAESYRSSSFAAANNQAQVAGFAEEYTSDSRFAFTVEGELDKGELAALNDLFSQVNDIADDFYAGDVEAAFNQALEVGYDASELAGFAVNMRRSEVVAVRQAYTAVANYGEPPAAASSQNPLQSIMDKLADFSAKVQQAQASLLESGDRFMADNQLFNQLLKQLPSQQQNAETSNGEPRNKVESAGQESFADFVDTLFA